MEVTSIIYIIAALISVFIFYLLKSSYRTIFLVLLSCGFIVTYSYLLLVYVLAYALFNFFLARKISVSTKNKALFRTGIFVNLTQLIVLRYASFAIDPVFQAFNSDFYLSALSNIILPLGISYYTLQGIGYLINVKMKWEKPEESFADFLLYIVFAPKFISGPIERSNHFIPQLKNYSKFESENISAGLRIALIGFFKKVVIANHLSPTVIAIHANPELYGGSYMWLLIILQPLYLYFDFSGYTDIAIGVARMFGIDLLPNFNRPFMAENMTNFWKRFHISLSSWFNDYIFKQTSFRLRKWKGMSTVVALLLTWTLFGIWHGAGWNFMILGAIQAIAILYEFYTKRFRSRLFSKFPGRVRVFLYRLFTFVFFGFALTFFFSPDIKSTLKVLSLLSEPFNNSLHGEFLLIPLMVGLILSAVMLTVELIQEDYSELYHKASQIWQRHRVVRYVAYYLLGFLILSQLGGTGVFVYQMF